MKYRKKPVVIEAIQFTDSFKCMDELTKFMGKEKVHFSFVTPECPYLPIDTLEGVMIANVGDYIIKGVKGEFYPCKPDIFEKTYEKVEEE